MKLMLTSEIVAFMCTGSQGGICDNSSGDGMMFSLAIIGPFLVGAVLIILILKLLVEGLTQKTYETFFKYCYYAAFLIAFLAFLSFTFI